MMEKKLGKISRVHCGHGGYQDCMLGVSFTLEGSGWGVGTPFYGAWNFDEVPAGSKWTHEERLVQLGEALWKLGQWMKQAKVERVEDLAGIPVECTFEGMALKDWRILTEVL